MFKLEAEINPVIWEKKYTESGWIEVMIPFLSILKLRRA